MKKPDLIAAIPFFVILFISKSLWAQDIVYGNLQKPKTQIRAFTEWCFDASSGFNVLVRKINYVYGTDGKLSEQKIYNTIDTNVVDQIITYIYEGNDLIEEQGLSDTSLTKKKLVDTGYLIKYLFDDKSRKIARKYKSALENNLERYEYDEKDNLVLCISYSNDGKLRFKEEYKYDNLRNLIMKVRDEGKNSKNSVSITYSVDAKRNRIGERVYASNGYLKYAMTYDYDDKNNRIEEIRYSAHGSFEWKRKYKYEYDNKGNWTTLITNHKLGSYIVNRSITYP